MQAPAGFQHGEKEQTAGLPLYLLAPVASSKELHAVVPGEKDLYFLVQTSISSQASHTWASPAHTRTGGRRGTLGCTHFGQSSGQSPGHTCTRVPGICPLWVLEEEGNRSEPGPARLQGTTQGSQQSWRQALSVLAL